MIDVCFFLEGTYPYVAGGVSTWVHQLITAMRDIRFGIVYIAPHSDPTRRLKYEVPNNVLYLKEIYLHDYNLAPQKKRKPKPQDYELIRTFYEELETNCFDSFRKFYELFRGEQSCFDTQSFFSSEKIFDLLNYFYDRYSPGISYIDFFWTWRGTHLPLLQSLTAEIPAAKIYHSISTGYAGLISAIARQSHGGKLFLTEHGIYTHERTLEISQANWIYEREQRHFRAERELSFFKTWWIRMFQLMNGITYHACDQIFTLFEGNKVRQILSGAEPEKISIIPNGIDIRGTLEIRRNNRPHPQIALIGRVVNIKDIKTFILAARLVLKTLPKAQFHVIGPFTEERDYYDECKLLVETLNLEENISFTGPVNVREYYQFLDVVVLTSLSEAQPYVILEANLAGIPMVATDVGACREMLEGRDEPDKILGKSGLLTEVSSPESTATAILKLIQDPALYKSCSEAGRARIQSYYDQDDLFSRYLNLYERNL